MAAEPKEAAETTEGARSVVTVIIIGLLEQLLTYDLDDAAVT